MNELLDAIMQSTYQRVELAKKQDIEFNLDRETKSLVDAIVSTKKSRIPIISEIKPASPTLGKIRRLNIRETAKLMKEGGACAISVLTEPNFFQGTLENIQLAKVGLPILRKDFVIDKYQLYESKHYGADAVLLIVKILKKRVGEFIKTAKKLGLECLVEVHNSQELELALKSKAGIIGINNRDLGTLEIDLKITEKLAPMLPDNIICVTESGIATAADLQRLIKAGADAALIGASIMKSNDIKKAVSSFVFVK